MFFKQRIGSWIDIFTLHNFGGKNSGKMKVMWLIECSFMSH